MLGFDCHAAGDGKLDFSALKRQGFAFMYAKATEGATFTDPLYKWYQKKAAQCVQQKTPAPAGHTREN